MSFSFSDELLPSQWGNTKTHNNVISVAPFFSFFSWQAKKLKGSTFILSLCKHKRSSYWCNSSSATQLSSCLLSCLPFTQQPASQFISAGWAVSILGRDHTQSTKSALPALVPPTFLSIVLSGTVVQAIGHVLARVVNCKVSTLHSLFN